MVQCKSYLFAFGSRARVAWLCASLLFCCSEMALAQKRADSSKVAQEIRTLVLGKAIEREFKGGEVHAYQIWLISGQYLPIGVQQKGMNIKATMLDPINYRILA